MQMMQIYRESNSCKLICACSLFAVDRFSSASYLLLS